MVRVGYCSNGFFYLSAKKLYGCNSIDLFFSIFSSNFFSLMFFFFFLPFLPFFLSLFLLLALAVSDPLFERKGKNAVPLSQCPVTFFSFDFFSVLGFSPTMDQVV